MNFIEAFRFALAGGCIRRNWWHPSAKLRTNETYHLVRDPGGRHWNGPYEVCLDDVEATDWVECDDAPAP